MTGAALARTRAAAATLGLDVSAELDAIDAFLDGTFTVAVAGLAGSGRSRIGAAISAATHADVRELDVKTMPALPLWDLLIIVTAAERALGRIEEELVRSVRARKLPVIVAVTRADLLGDAAERSAGEREIESFRLTPALGSIGVRWFFTGEPDPPDRLTDAIRTALGTDLATAHHRPAELALDDVLDGLAAQLGDRLAKRAAEQAILQSVESRQSAAITRLEEEARLSRMAVPDRVRTGEEAVFAAATNVSQAAAAWVAHGGLGAWSEIEFPLRRALPALSRVATDALATEHDRFGAEIGRLLERSSQAARSLGIDDPYPGGEPPSSWSTPAVEDAAAVVAATDLTGLLGALERRCREALEHTEEEKGRLREFGNRIEAGIQRLTGGASSETELETELHADLETIIRPRLTLLLNAVIKAAEDGTKADTAVAIDRMRTLVKIMQKELAGRYAWGDAYAEILELQSRGGYGRTSTS